MALYTRKEFAALCHTDSKVVGVYIRRGKIIENDERKIDSEVAENKKFFDDRQKKFEEEKVSGPKKRKKSADEAFVTAMGALSTAAAKQKAAEDKIKSDKKKRKLELRKKKADTELQEGKAEKIRLDIEKLSGKLIPTDLVFNIIKAHNTTIFATFQNDLENMAAKFCEILAGGDRALLGQITDELSHHLTDIIDKCREVAEVEVENAVKAYAQTRNRGEKK